MNLSDMKVALLRNEFKEVKWSATIAIALLHIENA